jgi:hypothetical protein
MKRYRLLKDLPFAKAGEIFCAETGKRDGISEITLVSENHITTPIWINDIENFDQWFEEIKEPKIFFTIDIYKSKFKEINTDYYSGWSALEVKNIKDLGLLFKTVEKTKKYLKYLKAKEIIKQDAKGFKPDWNNGDEAKFFGYWDFILEEPGCGLDYRAKTPNVYFQSSKDIKESFEKHPEEWKTYLSYEQ